MKVLHLNHLLLGPIAVACLLTVAAGCGNKPESTVTTPHSHMATPSSGPGAQGGAAGAIPAGGPPEAAHYRQLLGPNAKPPGAR